MSQCGAGYFDKLVQVFPAPSECGICEKPCSTCRKCDPSRDRHCTGDVDVASAKFCTACDQEGFFPEHFDDISDIENFFTQ